MSDTTKIHRWITQEELDAMLADAFKRGAEAMRERAADWYEQTPVVSVRLMRILPLPEDKS